MSKPFQPPRYLERFRDGYRYRRRVPADVCHKLPPLQSGRPRRFWKVTFPSRMSEAELKANVAARTSEHDALIAQARAGEGMLDAATIAQIEKDARDWRQGHPRERNELMGLLYQLGEAEPHTAALLSALEHGNVRLKKVTLADARAARGGERNERNVDTAMKSFAPFGGDKDARDIEEADVAAWIKHCSATMTGGAIDRYRKSLRAICAFGLRSLKVATPNPFDHKAHADSLTGDGKRLPFHRSHLEAIDSYLATSKRIGRETRNILRLMKLTAAGPAEIGGLTLGDVSLAPDDPYISIQPNELRGLKVRKKGGKEPARRRLIPLVGDALDAARDAVDHAKGADLTTPLFASFRTDGRGAVSISAKLNKVIRAAMKPARSKRLTCYSYRHTLAEALRNPDAHVSEILVRRICGWEGEGVAAGYGATSSHRAAMRDAIIAALPFLGDVPLTDYTAEERITNAKPSKARRAA